MVVEGQSFPGERERELFVEPTLAHNLPTSEPTVSSEIRQTRVRFVSTLRKHSSRKTNASFPPDAWRNTRSYMIAVATRVTASRWTIRRVGKLAFRGQTPSVQASIILVASRRKGVSRCGQDSPVHFTSRIRDLPGRSKRKGNRRGPVWCWYP